MSFSPSENITSLLRSHKSFKDDLARLQFDGGKLPTSAPKIADAIMAEMIGGFSSGRLKKSLADRTNTPVITTKNTSTEPALKLVRKEVQVISKLKGARRRAASRTIYLLEQIKKYLEFDGVSISLKADSDSILKELGISREVFLRQFSRFYDVDGSKATLDLDEIKAVKELAGEYADYDIEFEQLATQAQAVSEALSGAEDIILKIRQSIKDGKSIADIRREITREDKIKTYVTDTIIPDTGFRDDWFDEEGKPKSERTAEIGTAVLKASEEFRIGVVNRVRGAALLAVGTAIRSIKTRNLSIRSVKLGFLGTIINTVRKKRESERAVKSFSLGIWEATRRKAVEEATEKAVAEGREFVSLEEEAKREKAIKEGREFVPSEVAAAAAPDVEPLPSLFRDPIHLMQLFCLTIEVPRTKEDPQLNNTNVADMISSPLFTELYKQSLFYAAIKREDRYKYFNKSLTDQEIEQYIRFKETYESKALELLLMPTLVQSEKDKIIAVFPPKTVKEIVVAQYQETLKKQREGPFRIKDAGKYKLKVDVLDGEGAANRFLAPAMLDRSGVFIDALCTGDDPTFFQPHVRTALIDGIEKRKKGEAEGLVDESGKGGIAAALSAKFASANRHTIASSGRHSGDDSDDGWSSDDDDESEDKESGAATVAAAQPEVETREALSEDNIDTRLAKVQTTMVGIISLREEIETSVRNGDYLSKKAEFLARIKAINESDLRDLSEMLEIIGDSKMKGTGINDVILQDISLKLVGPDVISSAKNLQEIEAVRAEIKSVIDEDGNVKDEKKWSILVKKMRRNDGFIYYEGEVQKKKSIFDDIIKIISKEEKSGIGKKVLSALKPSILAKLDQKVLLPLTTHLKSLAKELGSPETVKTTLHKFLESIDKSLELEGNEEAMMKIIATSLKQTMITAAIESEVKELEEGFDTEFTGIHPEYEEKKQELLNLRAEAEAIKENTALLKKRKTANTDLIKKQFPYIGNKHTPLQAEEEKKQYDQVIKECGDFLFFETEKDARGQDKLPQEIVKVIDNIKRKSKESTSELDDSERRELERKLKEEKEKSKVISARVSEYQEMARAAEERVAIMQKQMGEMFAEMARQKAIIATRIAEPTEEKMQEFSQQCISPKLDKKSRESALAMRKSQIEEERTKDQQTLDSLSAAEEALLSQAKDFEEGREIIVRESKKIEEDSIAFDSKEDEVDLSSTMDLMKTPVKPRVTASEVAAALPTPIALFRTPDGRPSKSSAMDSGLEVVFSPLAVPDVVRVLSPHVARKIDMQDKVPDVVRVLSPHVANKIDQKIAQGINQRDKEISDSARVISMVPSPQTAQPPMPPFSEDGLAAASSATGAEFKEDEKSLRQVTASKNERISTIHDNLTKLADLGLIQRGWGGLTARIPEPVGHKRKGGPGDEKSLIEIPQDSGDERNYFKIDLYQGYVLLKFEKETKSKALGKTNRLLDCIFISNECSKPLSDIEDNGLEFLEGLEKKLASEKIAKAYQKLNEQSLEKKAEVDKASGSSNAGAGEGDIVDGFEFDLSKGINVKYSVDAKKATFTITHTQSDGPTVIEVFEENDSGLSYARTTTLNVEGKDESKTVKIDSTQCEIPLESLVSFLDLYLQLESKEVAIEEPKSDRTSEADTSALIPSSLAKDPPLPPHAGSSVVSGSKASERDSSRPSVVPPALPSAAADAAASKGPELDASSSLSLAADDSERGSSSLVPPALPSATADAAASKESELGASSSAASSSPLSLAANDSEKDSSLRSDSLVLPALPSAAAAAAASKESGASSSSPLTPVVPSLLAAVPASVASFKSDGLGDEDKMRVVVDNIGNKLPEINRLSITKSDLEDKKNNVITPDLLNLSDEKYYYAQFGGLIFDESKVAKDIGGENTEDGIFNGAKLFMAGFRGCKFVKVDFSKIPADIFRTLDFRNCEFEGCVFDSEHEVTVKDGQNIPKQSQETVRIISREEDEFRNKVKTAAIFDKNTLKPAEERASEAVKIFEDSDFRKRLERVKSKAADSLQADVAAREDSPKGQRIANPEAVRLSMQRLGLGGGRGGSSN